MKQSRCLGRQEGPGQENEQVSQDLQLLADHPYSMLLTGYLHVRGLCPCFIIPFPIFLSKIYLETEKVFLPNHPLMPQKSNMLHDVIRICKAWHGLNSRHK